MVIRFLLVCISQCVASIASAAAFNLTPSADAFVSSANPSSNYGGAGSFGVSAPGLAQGEFQSVMKFDTSAAKASFDSTFGAGAWTVTGISLQLTATSPNNPIFNNSAAGQLSFSWMQNDSWTEGTGTPAAPTSTGLTFNTLPSFLSASDQSLGTFSYSGATSGASSYAFSLTSGLSSDITSGNLASIRLLAGDIAVSGLFNARSFGTASARPILTITATPEPQSLLLLAAGVWGLIPRSRRTESSSC
jgi:hypothetical protein